MKIRLLIKNKSNDAFKILNFDCKDFEDNLQRLEAENFDRNKAVAFAFVTKLSEEDITELRTALISKLPIKVLVFSKIKYDKKMADLMTEILSKYPTPDLKIINTLYLNFPRQLKLINVGEEIRLWNDSKNRYPFQHEIDHEIFICSHQLTAPNSKDFGRKDNNYDHELNEASEMYGFLRLIKSTSPLTEDDDHYLDNMDVEEASSSSKVSLRSR